MDQPALVRNDISEEELVAGLKSGDGNSFRLLFELHSRKVYSIALNFFSGEVQTAEDVTQQVFVKIYGAAGSFRAESRLTTWIYRITVNACIDEQKRQNRFRLFSDQTESIPGSSTSHIQWREHSIDIANALKKLKPKYRIPVILKHVEGLSYREIASVLSCSEGTVASRLNRGHRMLARRLDHLRNEVKSSE